MKIKKVISFICIAAVAVGIVSMCGCDNLTSDGSETPDTAESETVYTYIKNNGEFNWKTNKVTSLFPKPDVGSISQYSVFSEDDYKCCSVLMENFGIDDAKEYSAKLEKNGFTTDQNQTYDSEETTIYNYVAVKDNYRITLSQSGIGCGILCQIAPDSKE